MAKTIVGLDIETYDPLLKTAGWSWKYKTGYILATALYYEASDEVKVIAGLNNNNCPYSTEERVNANKEIYRLLTDTNVCIVGANIMYDIGWLLYEYKMNTYDVKCTFVDVLQAEHILDEYSEPNLDGVSWKYLKYGKAKERIEDWVRVNVSNKGDFRQNLKDAPYDLLCEYVVGDAKNPVNVWKKQFTELKAQELLSRVKIEFDCILPILQITINGYPIDNEQRKKNCELLQHYVNILEKEFREKYDFPKFRVTATRDIAKFCDNQNIPYKCKITLTGEAGIRFTNTDEVDGAYRRAKKVVSNFRLEKGKPVALVPKELTDRTCELLKEEGYMFNCSPNVDKKFFASQRDNYPEIALIADWKLAVGIISKILGEKYDRFVFKDDDGVTRTHGQFKITDTTSFRLSSNMCNMQQIPSKGGFTITDNGEKKEISFPALTRALFGSNPNEVLWKIDYGQIEYRLICNIACGEDGKKVREEYAKNPKLDFHQYTVDLTGLSRKYAKNMSFGISFGMGLPSMASNFGWTIEKATEIAEQYNTHLPFVQPTLALVGDVAVQRGYIKTVCGSRCRCGKDRKGKKYTYLNRYTQGSGAEILKSSIIRAYKEGVWKEIGVMNTVHDELNGSVPPTEEKLIKVYQMAEFMRDTVPLRVPLEAEPEFGMNWAGVHTVSEWVALKEESNVEYIRQPQILKDTIDICVKLIDEGKVNVQ